MPKSKKESQKVLVTWIGKTDLKAPSAGQDDIGPLARILEEHRFDQILMMSDFPEARQDVIAFRQWLTVRCKLTHPIAFHSVRPEEQQRHVTGFYEATVRVLCELELHNDELWFNVSSGMPYMQFSQMLLARTISSEPRLLEASRDGVTQIGFTIELRGKLVHDMIGILREDAAKEVGRAVELGGITYTSPVMRDVMLSVDIFRARVNSNVLIVGPVGTPTDDIGRLIANNKYVVTVNCGTIRDDEFESKFFGSENADGFLVQSIRSGLLLLDAHLLSREAQLKLYQARTVGFHKPKRNSKTAIVTYVWQEPFSARLLATTTIDPRCRKGLSEFHHLFVIGLFTNTLRIPALKDRPSDIMIAANYYLDRLIKEPQTPELGFLDAAEQVILNYHWPHNLLELRKVVAEIVTQPKFYGDGASLHISAADVMAAIAPMDENNSLLYRPFDVDFDLDTLVAEFKLHYYKRAMIQADMHQAVAGRLMKNTDARKISVFRNELEKKLGSEALAGFPLKTGRPKV